MVEKGSFDRGPPISNSLREHGLLDENDESQVPLGYVNRQAVYACQTCSSSESGPAGVCLACSYECHEGHELFELYTKRNFRCDCGNNKFPGFKCKLYEFKDEANPENVYNQNFKGLYCTCHRPYPDADNDDEDEMIQCVICEDWFHGLHLVCTPDETGEFDEMVCMCCMKKNDFLWAYTIPSQATVIEKENDNINVNIEESPEKVSIISENGPKEGKSTPEDEASNSEDITHCKLKELQKREITVPDSNAFWSKEFRSKLCRCPQCQTMYENKGVSFLLDINDTVQAYEERGRQKLGSISQHAQGVHALSQMDHVQQVEVLHGFNDLKSELNEYLKKFAENGKVVREEDIREFFKDLTARKRQRVGAGVQYLCK